MKKHIQSIYSPTTAEAFSAYNDKHETIATEREAVAAERAAIVADALAGNGTATQLRKRIDAACDRALQADLAELATLGELPALDAMARDDWRSEETRLQGLEAERTRVLEAHADELGTEGPQRHNFILTDKIRRGLEEGRKAAAENTPKNRIITSDDTARAETLRAAIVAALN